MSVMVVQRRDPKTAINFLSKEDREYVAGHVANIRATQSCFAINSTIYEELALKSFKTTRKGADNQREADICQAMTDLLDQLLKDEIHPQMVRNLGWIPFNAAAARRTPEVPVGLYTLRIPHLAVIKAPNAVLMLVIKNAKEDMEDLVNIIKSGDILKTDDEKYQMQIRKFRGTKIIQEFEKIARKRGLMVV